LQPSENKIHKVQTDNNTQKISQLNKFSRLKKSFYQALKNFGTAVPTILGVVLLTGLFNTFVSKEMISSVFQGNPISDTVIGSVVGSISAGNPITSYIIGGELLKDHVSLFAVTAFIVAWVTVGIVQLPAEAAFLGRRFAFLRNGISFVLSIFIAVAVVITLMVI